MFNKTKHNITQGQKEISETRASERARTSRLRLADLCERRSLNIDVQ